MEERKTAGYREAEHTADWEIEVWAPDLPSLLEYAARGMYALSGVNLKPGPRITRRFEFQISDGESVLVDFLSELIYLGEVEGVGFDGFEFTMDGDILLAKISGAPIQSQSKSIKAVTYHNLKIRESPDGLNATIVFDV